MRILFSAVLAASFAAVSLPALAQTAPAPTPVKQKACKKLKDEAACGPRTDCKWSAPTDPKTNGKCATAPKPKTT
jgi:hypothetical protein